MNHKLQDTTIARTRAAAEEVIRRAARDGERAVCLTRIALAITTLIGWPVYLSVERGGLAAAGVSDCAVMVMSLASLGFGVSVLYWLRGAGLSRMTHSLRYASILVDATLLIGGLAVFVAVPPPEYRGILHEPGLNLVYLAIVAAGIRLSRRASAMAVVVFSVGVIGLMIADGRDRGFALDSNFLTTWGSMLTASVLAVLIAARTRRHVLDGAANAAVEIDALNAQLQVRVRERSDELSLALAAFAKRRVRDGTLKVGAMLADRFEIVRLLGQGGMGRVYSGIDRHANGARVAIKVIDEARSASEFDRLRRFCLETRAAATISHPAIVRMLDIDVTSDGIVFQAQELVDGVTLEEFLERGRLAPGHVARIGELLCAALAVAHEHGLVHRDVKPSNVMLTEGAPGLKLLDFGVVKVREANADDGETGDGVIVGTPAYMAPEQLRAEGSVSDRADIFAVGLVLLRALTSRSPWLTGSRVVDPNAIEAVESDRLRACIGSCLGDEPGVRPSAPSLCATLRGIADDLEAGPLESFFVSPEQADPPPEAGDDARGPGSSVADANGISALFEKFAPSETQPPHWLVDRQLGRYRLRDFIGESVRGGVWLAVDERLQRRVAVRVAPRDATVEQRAAFVASARAAAAFNHPNVCTIFDVEEHEGAAWVAMELVGGTTLREALSGGLSESRAQSLALDVLRALLCAHEAGLCHGAVALHNVRLVPGAGAKLLDLGVHEGGDAASDLHQFRSMSRELLLDSTATRILFDSLTKHALA